MSFATQNIAHVVATTFRNISQSKTCTNNLPNKRLSDFCKSQKQRVFFHFSRHWNQDALISPVARILIPNENWPCFYRLIF